MSRAGKRTPIGKNCYQDGTGRSITYRTPDGRQREIRFPSNAAITEMRAEVARRLEAARGSGQASVARGTLAAGVDAWEPLEQTLASWQERRAELRAWCRASVNGVALGDMQMAAIDAPLARRVMSQWATADVKPKTIRNRRWSLQHLYRVLYGPKTATPVDDVPPPAKTKTIPQAIAPDLVLAVYARLQEQEQQGLLRDAKTRARFMVRAATGKRPSEIMRTQPADLDLQRREWRVRDGKGGWSEGLYLNDDMITAWKVFIAAKAWGEFNTGSFARVLRHAGWPTGVRPYELRHSVGIALSDAGIDLSDIAPFLGHRDLRTTRETYVPIRAARMQRASEALEGRFRGWGAITVPLTHGNKRKLTVKIAKERSTVRKRKNRHVS